MCDECDYTAKSDKDMKNHLRDDHLEKSTSMSPPPKKKRYHSNEKGSEALSMEIDDLSSMIDSLDITVKEDNSEKEEWKKRSLLMDQKVMDINRKRDEEEKKEIERRYMVEAKRKKEADLNRLIEKELTVKRKRAQKKKMLSLRKLNS